MIGTTLVFKKKTSSTTDAMGNPITTTQDITVDDCLIAPISTPTNAREQLAIEQGKLQVEIHIPNTDNNDLSNCTTVWNGKTYQIDAGNAEYMTENTPTRWNKRLRGEAIDT